MTVNQADTPFEMFSNRRDFGIGGGLCDSSGKRLVYLREVLCTFSECRPAADSADYTAAATIA